MGEREAREIGAIVGAALDDVGERAAVEKLRGRVRELTSRFDVP
jgi:glycine/serine hydroxymethyltransferase